MSCNIVIWWNIADDKGKHHLKKHEGRGGGSSTECYTVPFPHTYFRTFNCCKCTIFKLWIQTESQRFLDFFTGLKCSFWPLWTFSQIEMIDFPILSYTSTCKISTLSYAWSLKRVLFSGGASPYRPLLGVPPPTPPPPHTHGKKHYRLCYGFQSLSTRFFRFTTIRWVPALGGLCGRPVE